MTVRALDLILGEPWAITPDGMQQVLAIAQRLNESPEAVSTRLGKPLDNTRRVQVRDGVALIPVTGTLFRRANLFTALSGATSIEVLATDIQAALDNDEVERVVLEIDSPGGQAAGIAELAEVIANAGKPILTHTDGQAASAAYWLAVAGSAFSMSSTAMVGSIGVVVSYRPEKDAPIKIISSQSPLKHADPSTDAGRSDVQRICDDMAAVFIADVARYRGVSEEHVLEQFGRGSMLVGAKAVAAGMADRIGILETLFIARGATDTRALPWGASAPHQPEGESPMPVDEAICAALGLATGASADDAVAAINARAQAAEARAKTARAEGADAERTRIYGILEHAEAEGRLGIACQIAKTPAITPDTAGAVLAAVPKADRNDGDRLAEMMARLGNPPVDPDGDHGAGSDDSPAALVKSINAL